jgi:thymidylate synthase
LNYYEVDTVSDAFIVALDECLAANRRLAPRGQPIREVTGPLMLTIAQPRRLPVLAYERKFRHAITAVEGLSLVGQTSVPELVTDRVKAFRPFLNDSIFWGAYGPRAHGDVGNVVELLKRDPDSRQAVISLYDSDRDLNRSDVVDVPCTLTLQFMIRDHSLEMVVNMRSNDVWLGLPYDLGQFAMLQGAIAQSLGVRVGTYTHIAASMHLYERDAEKASKIVSSQTPTHVVEWGEDDIGSIAERARRLLLGQAMTMGPLTEFETWLHDRLQETSRT